MCSKLTVAIYIPFVFHRSKLTGNDMKDMREHLQKLQVQIAECEMIRDTATDPKKRELFARLAEHHKVLANEIKKAMSAQ